MSGTQRRDLLLGMALGVGLVWALLAARAPSSEAAPPSTLPAVGASSTLSFPSLLKVGLATDLNVVELPCCEGDLVVTAGGRQVAAVATIRVEPYHPPDPAGAFRLQVAALKDEGQAVSLAGKLEQLLGQEADVVFDAGSDLYRVRVGRFDAREAAEEGQRKLAMEGVTSSWVVVESQNLTKPDFRVIQGGKATRVAGRWLEVQSVGAGGIEILGSIYRGRVLVYLNNRGTLNVINEVSLEDYLRGVVPKEMGPRVYDQLEALKAQTVAARTYTLRNLGEFGGEGYDICATPRCQVYGGMGVEDPLTDEAVAETAGEILVYEGEPADALYSSTCGGHTEDVEIVFPLKKAPYLRGVPCLEAGLDHIGGAETESTLAKALSRRLLPFDGSADAPLLLGERMERLAILAGLPVPPDRLGSMERREVRRFIGSTFDLALDARLFLASEDLPYLLDSPPPEWSAEDRQLAAYLIKNGFLVTDLEGQVTQEEAEEMLLQLALYLRVVELRPARYLALQAGQLRYRIRGQEETISLGDRPLTFRRQGEREVAGRLGLLAGDRIELYTTGSELLAIVHEVDPDGVAFDRTSDLSSWTRMRSDRELTALVNDRYPGLGFRGFEILARGRSGRVSRIRLIGEDGKTMEVEGLAVRWTLDLPDTLFTAKRLEPSDRESGWLFTGKGWGHGVGLCQVGAYGMAVRGHSYRDILSHYYSGTHLTKLGESTKAGS